MTHEVTLSDIVIHTYVRHRLDLLKARKSQGLWAELSFGLVSNEMILITIIAFI